jgi:hypothetical protein
MWPTQLVFHLLLYERFFLSLYSLYFSFRTIRPTDLYSHISEFSRYFWPIIQWPYKTMLRRFVLESSCTSCPKMFKYHIVCVCVVCVCVCGVRVYVCVCGILYLMQQEDIKVPYTSQFPPGLSHVLSRLGVRILIGMECGLDSGFASCYPAMDCCEHDWNFATIRLVQQLSAVRTIYCVIVSVLSSFFSVTGRSTQRPRICIRFS